MKLDDEVCLCFHVTKRKLLNFVRIERPCRAAQLSDCFGAGTGCGWCRPYLIQLFERATAESAAELEEASPLPSAEAYAQGRRHYVRDKGKTLPPGATPVD